MLDLHQIFFMYFDECSVTLFEGFLRESSEAIKVMNVYA